MADLYSQAQMILEKRRIHREEVIRSRREEVFRRVPRIAQIEKRLDATGMELLRAVADEKTDARAAVENIMRENRAACAEKAALLVENGFTPDFLEVPYVCDKCSDSGFTPDNKRCSCVTSAVTAAALREANLTQALREQTFENFNLAYYSKEKDEKKGISARTNAQSILGVAKKFVENFGGNDDNLWLHGPSGLGKTFLSSAIAAALTARGRDVIYISSNMLFPTLEDIHFCRDVSERSKYLAAHVIDCELLVLDDVGAEFVTPFTSAELFRIINTRILTRRAMVFSSNLSPGETLKVYSERITSRILGNFTPLEFFGDDIRRIKRS